MSAEIRVPSMGESIAEATVGRWLKNEGDAVAAGEPVVELETEKANVEIAADSAGTLERIARKTGDTVKAGDVVGVIGDGAGRGGRSADGRRAQATPEREREAPQKAAEPKAAGPAKEEPAAEVDATPVARKLAGERGVDLARVTGTGRGGKITREDVEAADLPEERADTPEERAARPAEERQPAPEAARPAPERGEERVRQTRRRQTIARRLVEAHNTAVMTTTFNEIDMSQVMDLRKRRREGFKERFGTDLGFMSFFVKAVVAALKAYPRINSSLDGDDVVLKRYYDIGVAVASDEGLVVPVLKNADRLSFADIEKAIAGMVQRTRDRKLTLEELQGGTFTITNGGVFGSLMSTPILNPPQVGILGMHRAFERPVAVEGKVEVRPMMYVALTYDHRVVDGADAVRFLSHVKGMIEDPGRLLIEG